MKTWKKYKEDEQKDEERVMPEGGDGNIGTASKDHSGQNIREHKEEKKETSADKDNPGRQKPGNSFY